MVEVVGGDDIDNVDDAFAFFVVVVVVKSVGL